MVKNMVQKDMDAYIKAHKGTKQNLWQTITGAIIGIGFTIFLMLLVVAGLKWVWGLIF